MLTKKLLLAALAVLVIACGACQRETRDEKLRRDFVEFTLKDCPKYVDPFTRLDSAVYDIPTRTLSYHYTVHDTLDDASLYTDEFRGSFHDTMLRELKGSIGMKSYKDMLIDFRYDWRSATSGQRLMELTFTPDDYRN